MHCGTGWVSSKSPGTWVLQSRSFKNTTANRPPQQCLQPGWGIDLPLVLSCQPGGQFECGGHFFLIGKHVLFLFLCCRINTANIGIHPTAGTAGENDSRIADSL